MARLTKLRSHKSYTNRPTYHITSGEAMNVEIVTLGNTTAMVGPAIQRLGEYENLGSVEEIKKKLGMG